MSRLGKSPLLIPKGVDVKVTKEGTVHFKGPKGSLQTQLPLGLHLKIDGAVLTLERDEKLSKSKAEHGLFRSLIKNQLIGVLDGFEIKLSLIGVGYRANVQGNKLDLQVGFSHPTAVDIPTSVKVLVDKGVAITVQGADKKEVGQFAASVRAVKPPEPYKGKGIRYVDEYVRKKEGKAAKGKA